MLQRVELHFLEWLKSTDIHGHPGQTKKHQTNCTWISEPLSGYQHGTELFVRGHLNLLVSTNMVRTVHGKKIARKLFNRERLNSCLSFLEL